jgi:hypothetical protein
MVARAKPFLFSNKASTLMGKFAYQCTDLLLQNRQFAIPPYDCMYLEFNYDLFLREAPERSVPDRGRQRTNHWPT